MPFGTQEADFHRGAARELTLNRELVLVDVRSLPIDLIGQHERPYDAQDSPRSAAGIRRAEVERIAPGRNQVRRGRLDGETSVQIPILVEHDVADVLHEEAPAAPAHHPALGGAP